MSVAVVVDAIMDALITGLVRRFSFMTFVGLTSSYQNLSLGLRYCFPAGADLGITGRTRLLMGVESLRSESSNLSAGAVRFGTGAGVVDGEAVVVAGEDVDWTGTVSLLFR